MMNLKLLAQGGDHSVDEICTIVNDDPFRDTVPANEILFDETDNKILGNGAEGSFLHQFCKIVNGH